MAEPLCSRGTEERLAALEARLREGLSRYVNSPHLVDPVALAPGFASRQALAGASDGAVAFMQEGRRAMKRDRWLLVEENGDLWLLKREGHELHGRIVSREGLRNEFPRLYAHWSRRTTRIRRASWSSGELGRPVLNSKNLTAQPVEMTATVNDRPRSSPDTAQTRKSCTLGGGAGPSPSAS